MSFNHLLIFKHTIKNMKLRLVYILFLGILCSIALLGNKNGRASTPPGSGNTGAPGDETAGGQPVVCNSCHTGSPITSTLAINVINASGDTVSQYIPGQQYTARVTVIPVTGNPQGYGFQMIALKDAGNVDLDGFTDTNPNNYKIATVNSTGRTYAEHDNVSTPNTFDVKWTAPPVGTGSVTFYAAGNAVNKNGLNSGDGASFSSLKLTEGSSSSTQNPDADRIALQVWPNPATTEAHVSVNLQQAGKYRLAVFDLSGRLVWEAAQQLPAGTNLLTIPVAGWDAGVYFATLTGGGVAANVKVVKF